MVQKRPLAIYNGVTKELRIGDTFTSDLLPTATSALFGDGLEVVLSQLGDGVTTTYTLSQESQKVLVFVDGILQNDFIQPDGTDQLVLGFAPSATELITALAIVYVVGAHSLLSGLSTSESHPASAIGNTPAGSIVSTDVQAAINELATEKAPALGTDDNYVTDAEKIVLANTSGTNTGDQTLPTDATLTFTDIETNNASTSKHGFFPKLPTPVGYFLRDDFTWQEVDAGVSDGDKGDITVSGSGATWTIDNQAVTLAKMADIDSGSLIYRKTAATGAPEVQTLATLKTDLGLTGTNSGDQIISDATISTTDITTNNASVDRHGFFPKLPTPVGHFLRDDFTWQEVTTTGTSGTGSAGLDQVLSSLGNGTNTFTLSKSITGIQVFIDGLLETDYTPVVESNQLVFGFIPGNDELVVAYASSTYVAPELLSSGLALIYTSMGNGTNTFTLPNAISGALVFIDGILETDYTPLVESDQLVFGFIPAVSEKITVYSSVPVAVQEVSGVPIPDAPTIISPTGIDVNDFTIITSAFTISNNDTHFSTQYQVSELLDFSVLTVDYIGTGAELLSYDCIDDVLTATVYYIRARHRAAIGDWSEWGTTVEVTTADSFGFSPLLAVALNGSPYVQIYSQSVDTFTKLSDLAILPSSVPWRVIFSKDGTYLAMPIASTPFITVYKRSGNSFTKLSDPASLPTGSGYGVAFSPDGVYLAISHDVTPYITIYKRSGDTFTKLANPSVLPGNIGLCVSFSSDGIYLIVGGNASPYITIYKRSGDTFTKLANPSTLPTGTVYDFSFSNDGVYLSVAHGMSPNMTVYKRSGDTFTKLANPSTLPPSGSWGCAFSPDGIYLALALSSGTPALCIYKRSGDTFIKLADPSSIPSGGAGWNCAFSADGIYLVIGYNASPFIYIYKRSGDTFTKLADPSVLPPAAGLGIAFYPSALYGA